jgi:hypothetical protein
VLHAGAHAVVHAFYVDLKNPFKVLAAGILDLTHMRDARAVYQYVDLLLGYDAAEHAGCAVPIRDVAQVGRGYPAVSSNVCRDAITLVDIHIQEVNASATDSKQLSNRPSDTAGATGYDGYFAIQSEHRFIALSLRVMVDKSVSRCDTACRP